MRIIWKPEFQIDGGLIDQDHMKIIEIINNFSAIEDSKFIIKEMKVILAHLKKYTIEHFQREELIQEKIGFDRCETHKIQHKNMVYALDKIINDFRLKVRNREFEYIDVKSRTFKLLQNWLLNHILIMDTSMKPYLEAYATKNKIEIEAKLEINTQPVLPK